MRWITVRKCLLPRMTYKPEQRLKAAAIGCQILLSITIVIVFHLRRPMCWLKGRWRGIDVFNPAYAAPKSSTQWLSNPNFSSHLFLLGQLSAG